MRVYVVTTISEDRLPVLVGTVSSKPTIDQMWEMLRDYLRENVVGPSDGQLSEDDLTSMLNAYAAPEAREQEVVELPKPKLGDPTWRATSRFEYSYVFDNHGIVATVYLEQSSTGDLRLRWHQEYDTEDEVLPLERTQGFELYDGWMLNELLALPYADVRGIFGHDGSGLFGLANKLQLKYDRSRFVTAQDYERLRVG